MNALLGWLADTTVSLTFLLAVLLLIRGPAARLLGAATAYRLWLLVPLHLAASLLPLEAAGLQPIQLAPLFTTADTTAAGAPAAAGGWLPWLAVPWLAGLGWSLAVLLRDCHQARQLVAGSTPVPAGWLDDFVQPGLEPGRILRTSAAASPMVAGMLRPYLLLPEDFTRRHDPREQRLILAHEVGHLRRRDNVATLAARVVSAFYWFHPLARRALAAFRTDQELSCDARALRRSGPSERKAYGRALVRCAATTDPVAAASSWQGQRQLKERTMMLKTHRHSPARALAGLAVVTTLAIGVTSVSVDAFATDRAMKNSGAAIQQPVLVERTPPRYPAAAAKEKIEGKVVMQFTVDTDGRVQDASVVRSEPDDRFNEAAMEALRQWRFEPARKDGEPVAVEARQAIRFEMD